MTAGRVGLFGGSFDPIHAGHVRPVQAARRALGLDRVIYLPTALPPHKPKRAFAPAHARYTMVEMALLDEPGLYASPHELTLERPAYTIETLEHFARELPGADLHLLVGGDSFLELVTWRRWRDILAAARLVVLARPGFAVAGAPAELVEASRAADGRVTFIEHEPVDLSATAIRALLARGEAPPPGSLARSVLDYVCKYALYR